jgi:peptide/nickel transport system substrate-binding protein
MQFSFFSPLNTHRRSLLVSMLIATSASLGAAPANETTKTLQVVAPWEIGSLDPSKSGYVFTRLQISETLVSLDNQGALAPGLASSWSVSPNQLVWTFKLRTGATFHDGTRVQARDVQAALERARKNPGVLGNVPLQRISADKDCVVFELSRPFTPLPAFLAQYSTQILAPSAYAADGSVQAIIGSGPYKVTRIEPPQKILTERFALWNAGTPPAIERVSYLAVSRGETRNLLASSGQADLVFTHDPANLDKLRNQKSLQLHTLAVPRSIYIKVNAAHPALKDTATRRALSMAIDRVGIATAVLREPKAAATQLFPPSMVEWHVAGLPALQRDLPQARALLKAAGWVAGADGMLSRDGKPFKLILRTFSDRPELPIMAAALQAQLREVGVDLVVSVGNSSEIPAGHKDGSLELALLARNYALVPDPVGTLLQDFGPQGGDWGAMGWSSATLREATDTLISTNNPQRRSIYRGSAATVLQAELPVIPVAWYQHYVSSSQRLRNVSIDPFEMSYRISQMQWAR